ncbi:DUF6232 family protein [Streptomyces sp. NPDC006450]|uniref:DUF6232 family protein n=1 Tax=Streptomyces sp. NPDC006450 TaxID=3155458 RepID=UPI0033A1A567
MESNGATAPPPPQQPPSQPAVELPAQPPAQPPSQAPQSPRPPQGPPLPPLPRGAGARGVHLRISRRLLWVGRAAYPLHNIVRVQTTVLTPDRGRAVVQFVKWAGVLFVAYILLAFFIEESPSSSYGGYEERDSTAETLVGVEVIVGMFLLAQLVYRLSRPDVHAMVVEVASASIALVTMEDESQLDVVVQHLVHAIDHPEAEFSIRMEKVELNLKSYHLGDSVNIYGGVGNTGVVKT